MTDDALVDDFRRWVKEKTGTDYAPRVLRKALADASGRPTEERRAPAGVAKDTDRELLRQIDALFDNLPEGFNCESGTIGAATLPAVLGQIQGDRIIVVDGDEIKTRPDVLPDDVEHPHMDFTEGSNDLAHPWCRREFGPNTILVDGLLSCEAMKSVLVHELTETGLMFGGMEYEEAHEEANDAEQEVRLASRLRPLSNGET